MSYVQSNKFSISNLFSYLKQALKGEQQDYTNGSIRKAIFMLAIPMILEMMMESVFAVVDIFFVGRLGKEATSTVGLTESVMTMVYSLAIGLSMAATAMVARRVGEKDPENASKAAAQAIVLSLFVTVIISACGLYYAKDILRLMGAPPDVIAVGSSYTAIMFGGAIVIILLFLINGIFRGAGDASIAMRSLWIANICNIILCPTLIYGVGDWDGWGLPGAAIATTIGRGIGVVYQLFHLMNNKNIIRLKRVHFIPDWGVIKSLLNIAQTATLQFIIASASWIVLSKLMAGFGSTAIAGYTVAIRVIMFFILPAWGMSNAAATLVGQNLGAKQPERAEESVWKTAKYSAGFMVLVSIFFLLAARPIISFMSNDSGVIEVAVTAMRIMSIGYVFYGVGMVVTNAFNGAGDSRTPTWINLFGFWTFQIPLAYLLAIVLNMGPQGIFFAIILAESAITIAGIIIFRKGKWKLVKI
jgi:putative MATE family efflux protein